MWIESFRIQGFKSIADIAVDTGQYFEAVSERMNTTELQDWVQ